MNNKYIDKVKTKNQKKELISNYIFGLFFGFSTTLIFIFRLLYKKINFLSWFDVLFILFGILCILLATINPRFRLLSNIRKKVTSIFNFIGEKLLDVILIIVYIIFVIPVGLFMKKKILKTKDQSSNFSIYKKSTDLDYNKNSKRYSILKIFTIFSSGYFYMIPLIIILIIISILVVLISSSVFTPLIYTLF